MARDGWTALREAVRDLAEGYAVTDPPNAYCYREEAVAFVMRPRPADSAEFLVRQEQAEALRGTWATRLRRYDN